MKPISQREARRLKKRVDELSEVIQKQRRSWCQQYPGGIHLGNIDMQDRSWLVGRIEAARMLHHAVVLVSDDTKTLRVYAIPQEGAL